MKYNELPVDNQLELNKKFSDMKELISFSNKTTLYTFRKIFPQYTDRLWDLFVTKCKRNIIAFLDCLTIDQKGDLFSNIFYNKELYV